ADAVGGRAVPADARRGGRPPRAHRPREDLRVPRLRPPDPGGAARRRRPRPAGGAAGRPALRADRRRGDRGGVARARRRCTGADAGPGDRRALRAARARRPARGDLRPRRRRAVGRGRGMTDGSSGSRLGHATLQGVRWVAVGRVATETIAFGSGIVLARLVPPAEFGRAAVAMIVVALAAILGPVGLTAVLIQRKSVDRCDLEAASFLSLVSGVVLTAGTLAFAHAGAPSVFGGETARLIGLASPAWLISAIGAVPQAQIQRDLRFQVVAVMDSVSVLAGAAVALGLAAGGVDAAAVVAGGLATTAAGTVIALLAAPSARPRPNRQGLANVGGFAASVSASSLVYSMFRNVDYAILGIRLAPRAVGLYWRAYQLGVDYQSKISQIMLRVAFPVYSRTESMDELRRFRRRIVRTHAVVVVPLMCFFIAIA